jgi:hypothetical protein
VLRAAPFRRAAPPWRVRGCLFFFSFLFFFPLDEVRTAKQPRPAGRRRPR